MLIKESKLRQIIKSIINETYDKYSDASYASPMSGLPAPERSYNLNQELYGYKNEKGQNVYDPKDVGKHQMTGNKKSAFDIVNMSSGLCVKDLSGRNKNSDQKTYSVTLGLDSSGQSQKMIKRNRFDIDEEVECPELTCQEAAKMMGIPNNVCKVVENYLINPTNPDAYETVNVDIFENEDTIIVSFGGFFPKFKKIFSLSTGQQSKK